MKKAVYFLWIFSLIFLSSEGASALRELQEGMGIPHFSLTTIEGKKVNFENVKGKKGTVIIFWQTTTGNSLKALDYLRREADVWRSKGMEIIAINVEAQVLSTEEVIKIREMAAVYPFPFFLDEGLYLFDLFGVIALPTLILVDEKGIIQKEISGFPLVGVAQFFEEVAYFLGKKRETAKETYRPDRKAVLFYQMGLNQEKRGNLEQAMNYYERAILADGKYISPYRRLTEILLRRDEKEKVKMLLTKAPGELKKNPLFSVCLGMLSFHEGNLREAKQLLEESLNYEETPEIFLYLGFVLYREADTKGAETNFAHALEMSNRAPEILYKIGKFLINEGRYDKGLPYYREALEEILKLGNR